MLDTGLRTHSSLAILGPTSRLSHLLAKLPQATPDSTPLPEQKPTRPHARGEPLGPRGRDPPPARRAGEIRGLSFFSRGRIQRRFASLPARPARRWGRRAMGSVSLNVASSRRRGCLCSPGLLNLLVLLSLLSTNLLALLAFLFPRTQPVPIPAAATASLSTASAQVAAIAREIDGTGVVVPHRGADGGGAALPPELLLFLSPHALPLGRDARTGLTHMPASVAHACFRSPPTLALLSAFASYAPRTACPRNATLAHRLLSKGCEPLPRRRCLTRGPRTALPASNMGVDSRRWVKPRHDHEFLIDDVLRLGAAASTKIRIGFDVAGGAANFAARMRERGVTVVTTVLDNAGKPMNEFVAARGLFPLLLSPAHRFPFYDGVFDLVHVGTTALDEGGAPALGQAGTEEALEFFMFDVDRVLRVGGLLWIDSYMCHSEERRQVVVRLIGRFGYKKLKWTTGEKAAMGSSKTAMYLSAVLQKPARG